MKMFPLVVFLLHLTTAYSGNVGGMKMPSLSVPSDSWLSLPTNCTFDASKNYELYVTSQMIGSYMDPHLISRLQFFNRLLFNQKKCTFTLMNLTEEDSNIYTFITKYHDKRRIQSREEHFNVTVTRHIALVSPPNKSPQDHEDNIYVKKHKKKFSEERSSCLHRVFTLLLGDLLHNAANSAFGVGEYFSVAFQLVGTVFFIVWYAFGGVHSVFWAVGSASSLIVGMVMIMNCSRCHLGCLRRALRHGPHFPMPLWPLLITCSIVVAFSVIYHDITKIWTKWYLVAALMSLAVRFGLLGFYYCKPKRSEKNYESASTNPI
ncbi:uncharacterized protein [Eleutherodactylus coqui]|uniref:uncharacterized protein n=1 Tax=Eleutherodactylus coqui TaxID=57060 RepID=UPI003461D330